MLVGYEYNETTTEQINTPDGVTTKQKTVTKTVQPNMTAIIFTLANKDALNWISINNEQTNQVDPKTKYEVTIKRDK